MKISEASKRSGVDHVCKVHGAPRRCWLAPWLKPVPRILNCARRVLGQQQMALLQQNEMRLLIMILLVKKHGKQACPTFSFLSNPVLSEHKVSVPVT